MSEKNMQYSLLLDFYGEMLSNGQREMMELYYNEDNSLSEIAEQIGITRQGVRDAVRRAEDALSDYEEKLGLARRFRSLAARRDSIQTAARTLLSLCDTLDDRMSDKANEPNPTADTTAELRRQAKEILANADQMEL